MNVYELANKFFEERSNSNHPDVLELKNILQKEGKTENFYYQLLYWFLSNIGKIFLERIFGKAINFESDLIKELAYNSVDFSDSEDFSKVPIIFKINKNLTKEIDEIFFNYLQASLNNFLDNLIKNNIKEKKELVSFLSNNKKEIEKEAIQIYDLALEAKEIVFSFRS